MPENDASRATSHRSVDGAPMPDPGVACGTGVTRVHRITRSGSGSPDATEWTKAFVAGVAIAGTAVDATAAVPAATDADLRNVLRDMCAAVGEKEVSTLFRGLGATRCQSKPDRCPDRVIQVNAG